MKFVEVTSDHKNFTWEEKLECWRGKCVHSPMENHSGVGGFSSAVMRGRVVPTNYPRVNMFNWIRWPKSGKSLGYLEKNG